MASVPDSIECPDCGESFDPKTQGGWCTNPDCGSYKWEPDEAEEKTKILEDKHGDDAADDVDELDEQVTRVKEGGRGEQNETTIVKDDDEGF